MKGCDTNKDGKISKKVNNIMVSILDGNSEHVAHTSRKIGFFRRKKIQFVTVI